ncbi:MAG: type II toxin-antitoxin system MqsA family antitoxin [Chlamydiae bacterium]|nr:type II toxin-antitoxin system MqsA family antitoxin [Chlamydiota bacterium]MBI3277097.1 type II toxin-antitoxin system MqsA family antitoxin [Chlamydiota bacterium]
MKCRICGDLLKSSVTDLPFKTSKKTIVILKKLPVTQCLNCGEYVLDDSVMKHVEKLLSQVSESAELEILKYAA